MAIGQREDGSLVILFGDGDVLVSQAVYPPRPAPLGVAFHQAAEPLPLGVPVPPAIEEEVNRVRPVVLLIFPTAKSVDVLMETLAKVKGGLQEAEAAWVVAETPAQAARGEP